MSKYVFKISIPEGLHARPCAKVIEILQPFTPLSFSYLEKTVDSLSILELLLLKIGCGESLTLNTNSALPHSVIEELQQVFGGCDKYNYRH